MNIGSERTKTIKTAMKEKTEMTDKDLEWEEISTEHIIQDQWIDFRKSAYRYPDGRVFSPFYSYSRRDYAVIVASDKGGRFICVRQFRQGIKKVTTEFPAGGTSVPGSDLCRTGQLPVPRQ